jgi:hypothetical protein
MFQLISLVDTSGWQRVDLVMIPPETDPVLAGRALALAGLNGDLHRAGQILQQASRQSPTRVSIPGVSISCRLPTGKQTAAAGIMNAVVTGAIALLAIFGGISALRVLLTLRVSRRDRGIAWSEDSLRP